MEYKELDTGALTPPLLSVSITAYNSAEWLARALDSVLMQRTTFPIEIVIGDDCSQDNTVAIAHAYRTRHPDMIRVFERSKNAGIQRNYYDTLANCRGKYIAWLDADDYWIDPDKLAIQVKLLEEDPSVSLCCHFVRWVSTNGEVKRDRYPSIAAGRYGLADIIRHDFLPTASAVFRNGINRGLPSWYFDIAPTTDWPVWILAALSGDIVLLDRIMAEYWLTPTSACWSKGALFWYRMDARFYENVESMLPPQWHRLVRAEKGRRYEFIAYDLRKNGEFTASRKAALKAFLSPSLMDNVRSKTKTLLAAAVREIEWRLQGGKSGA
jgi:glycosyltransferase involved in cell wall biosynthesis